MSKHTSPAFTNLADYKAKKADEGTLVIKGAEREYRIPPIELMTDDQVRALQDADKDPLAAGRALLGDGWADFEAEGGTALLAIAIYRDHVGGNLGGS